MSANPEILTLPAQGPAAKPSATTLQDSFWQNEVPARQETFTGLLTGADPVSLPEGGLQLAVTGICELLRDLCNTENQPDPNTYVRESTPAAALATLAFGQHT